MRFIIVTPADRYSTKGNRITAERWARILRQIGHSAQVAKSFDGRSCDVLIALHARRSASSISEFRSKMMGRPVIVAMTGTDLHDDMQRTPIVHSILRQSDYIVLLEPKGGYKLSRGLQKKVRVIFQSASRLKKPPKKLKRFFEVSVLAHLRPVKDPFRAAMAAQGLPESSRVRIVHFGQALSSDMKCRAKQEMERNSRYRWFGPVTHAIAKRRLARSHLVVSSSRSEGASVVLSEAIVNHVPVLATRIDASIGMLGADYPGLFEVGDTKGLARLISLAETDTQFYRSLQSAGSKLKSRFSLAAEVKSWKSLIGEIKR